MACEYNSKVSLVPKVLSVEVRCKMTYAQYYWKASTATEGEEIEWMYILKPWDTYLVNNVKQKHVEMLGNFIWVQMSKIGIREYLKRKEVKKHAELQTKFEVLNRWARDEKKEENTKQTMPIPKDITLPALPFASVQVSWDTAIRLFNWTKGLQGSNTWDVVIE